MCRRCHTPLQDGRAGAAKPAVCAACEVRMCISCGPPGGPEHWTLASPWECHRCEVSLLSSFAACSICNSRRLRKNMIHDKKVFRCIDCMELSCKRYSAVPTIRQRILALRSQTSEWICPKCQPCSLCSAANGSGREVVIEIIGKKRIKGLLCGHCAAPQCAKCCRPMNAVFASAPGNRRKHCGDQAQPWFCGDCEGLMPKV